MASIVQRTLKTCIPYVGTGLHSGCRIGMLVRPGEMNTGVRFIRKDVPMGRGVIPCFSPRNAILVNGEKIVNDEGLRFSMRSCACPLVYLLARCCENSMPGSIGSQLEGKWPSS